MTAHRQRITANRRMAGPQIRGTRRGRAGGGGSRSPAWSGTKGNPMALGVLTIGVAVHHRDSPPCNEANTQADAQVARQQPTDTT